jgi:hypothetical protein
MFNYIILALPSSAVLKPVQAGLGKIDSPYIKEFSFTMNSFLLCFRQQTELAQILITISTVWLLVNNKSLTSKKLLFQKATMKIS